MSVNKDNLKKLGELVEEASTVLVLQPEKPDTDSLSSTLVLEHILGDLGKEVTMYCQDEVPRYLRHLKGWDRVDNKFPAKFDLTILVDTGGPQMLARTLEKHQGQLVKKPFVIIDHHPTRNEMGFEAIEVVDDKATSTAELLFEICQQLKWPLNVEAATLMVPAILADTRNLTIPTVGSKEFKLMAKLIDMGVNLFQVHEDYRQINTLDPVLVKLKGRLLERAELLEDGKIALVEVTPDELKRYADIHDPADIVMYDLQRVEGVQIVIVIRNYAGADKKIKISTRANAPIAAQACAELGGGGHDRAAGCSTTNRNVSEVREQFVKIVKDKLKTYEALQHA